MKKGKRPRKKVVLVLVEGFTDIEVLANPISELYLNSCRNEEISARFWKMKQFDNEFGGDITSQFGVDEKNIEGVINKCFIE